MGTHMGGTCRGHAQGPLWGGALSGKEKPWALPPLPSGHIGYRWEAGTVVRATRMGVRWGRGGVQAELRSPRPLEREGQCLGIRLGGWYPQNLGSVKGCPKVPLPSTDTYLAQGRAQQEDVQCWPGQRQQPVGTLWAAAHRRMQPPAVPTGSSQGPLGCWSETQGAAQETLGQGWLTAHQPCVVCSLRGTPSSGCCGPAL